MIKINMSMPKCCLECPFYSGFQRGTCLADNYNGLYFGDLDAEYNRHPECPLQEVEEDD